MTLIASPSHCLQSMPDAVVYSDAEGKIRYLEEGSGKHLRLCRVRGDRQVARHHRSREPAPAPLGRLCSHHAYRRDQMVPETFWQVPAIRKDGSRISTEFTIVPFSGRGSPAGWSVSRRSCGMSPNGSRRCVPSARPQRVRHEPAAASVVRGFPENAERRAAITRDITGGDRP